MMFRIDSNPESDFSLKMTNWTPQREGIRSPDRVHQKKAALEPPRIVWARLRRVPISWPVLIVDQDKHNYQVFIKSDNALLTVKIKNCSDFPGNLEKMKTEAIDILKKKKLEATLTCYEEDVNWATDQCSNAYDTSRETPSERCSNNLREHYSNADDTSGETPSEHCSNNLREHDSNADDTSGETPSEHCSNSLSEHDSNAEQDSNADDTSGETPSEHCSNSLREHDSNANDTSGETPSEHCSNSLREHDSNADDTSGETPSEHCSNSLREHDSNADDTSGETPSGHCSNSLREHDSNANDTSGETPSGHCSNSLREHDSNADDTSGETPSEHCSNSLREHDSNANDTSGETPSEHCSNSLIERYSNANDTNHETPSEHCSNSPREHYPKANDTSCETLSDYCSNTPSSNANDCSIAEDSQTEEEGSIGFGHQSDYVENSKCSDYEADSDFDKNSLKESTLEEKGINCTLSEDEAEDHCSMEKGSLTGDPIGLGNQTDQSEDSEFSDYETDSHFESKDKGSLQEKHLTRDECMPGIYIRKLRRSHGSSRGQSQSKKRGNTRVYDNYHACLFCGELRQHMKPHLKVHKNIYMVKELLKDEKPDLTAIRKKGDHKNNVKVLKKGSGEVILSRRPDRLDISKFGPCPNCKEWLLLKNIGDHFKRCEKTEKRTITKRQLIIQSQVLSGVIGTKPSPLMMQEVFPSMLVDNVGDLAKKDNMIVALGESWLRRSIDNREKRRNYTSQHMRLMAKLLIELRKADGEDCAKPLSDYLRTKYFDNIVNAALQLCLPLMDDIEQLQSPSNAIKLKYDLRRTVSAKWALLVKNDPHCEQAKEMQTVLELISLEWGERLTKVARAVMVRRSFKMRKELPAPQDVVKLTCHVADELKALDLSTDNYFRVVQLTQTRLLMYNKRRSGEIDAISLESFAAKTKDVDEMDESIMGEMTKVEKYLLQTQDMMTVRGKGHRPVPVIIPPDACEPLEFVASYSARRGAGVLSRNKYLFPNKENGCARSYDSLKKTCQECHLTAPGRITSVSMRKYTATLTQMLNLDKYQLEWVCRHLGHSTDVHKNYYRHMSGYVERVQLSKLFLLQDMNLTSKFKGKSLEEIDISELVFPQPESAVSEEETDLSRIPAEEPCDNETTDIDEDVFELETENEQSDYEDDEEELKEKKNRKTAQKVKRQPWDSVEIKELKEFFQSHLNSKVCPRKSAVEAAKKLSKKRGGKIWMRSNDKIVKKISALNHK